MNDPFRCHGLFHHLREQRHSVGEAPAQGVRCTQGRSHPGEIEWKVRVPTDAHGAFEQGERPGQVALAKEQHAYPMRGKHQACGVSKRLGDPESFFPEGSALGEQCPAGHGTGRGCTGVHGGQGDSTEALGAARTVEESRGLPEAVDRPTIVALGLICLAEALVRKGVQGIIPTGRGQRKGALAGGDGLVICVPWY